MSANTASAQEGATVTFTLKITNAVSNTQSGIVVTDLLPSADFTFVQYITGAGNYVAGTGKWSGFSLIPGGSATLRIIATINAGTAPRILTNSAAISASSLPDPIPTNNAASASILSTTATTSSDLALTLTGAVTPIYAGNTFTYHVTVSNNGPDVATSVQVTDLLPGRVMLVSSSPSIGTYVGSLWNIGTLGIGASTTLDIKVLAQAGSGGRTIINSATISRADQSDSDTTNNSDSNSLTVQNTGERLIMGVSETAPHTGDTIVYSLTITNWSGLTDNGVQVTDILPAQLTFITSSATQGSYGANVWNVGTLASGSSANLTLSVLVPTGTGGLVLTNTANITAASQINPNPSDTTDSATIDIISLSGQSDLGVVITSNNLIPSEGTSFQYTILVTNGGPNTATNVLVNAAPPTGITYTGVSASQGFYNSSTHVWTLSNLGVGGAPAMLTLDALPNANTAGQIITDMVNVTADQTDLFPSNNTSSVPITVASADLGVIMTIDNPTPAVGDTVTYQVIVTNYGTQPTTSVAVSDIVPGGLTYAGSSATQGSYDNVLSVWSVGNLAVNGSATLSLMATVNTGAPLGTMLTNMATVSFFALPDPNSANNTASVTLTVSNAPTATNTLTPTMTFTPSDTPTPSATLTPSLTDTPTDTFTPSPTDTPTDTPTNTLTPSMTDTPTDTLTPSMTDTPTETFTPSPTDTPTDTFTPSPTDTPTDTPTNTLTPSATDTPTDTLTPSMTDTPTETFTPSPTDTPTDTFTPSPTDTPTDTPTNTLTPSATDTPTDTLTPSPTDTPTETFTPSPTNTPSDTPTATLTPSMTDTPTATLTPSLTDTPTATFTPTDTPTNTPLPSADLAVMQTVSSPTAPEGSIATFTVTVKNNGPQDDSGVALLDTVPFNVTFFSYTTSDGSVYNNTSGIWNVGTLAAGNSSTLTLVVRVGAGTNGQTITNTASINAALLPDPDGTNNSANASFVSTPALPNADISVSMLGSGAMYEGAPYSYTISVTDNGPTNATGLQISDVLPANVTLTSAVTGAGSYSSGTGIWNIGSLSVGSTATLTLSGVVNPGTAGAIIANTASLSALNQTDPNPVNNTATVSQTVQASGEALTQTANSTSPIEGTTDVLHLQLCNKGALSDNVTVSNTQPQGGLTFQSYAASLGTYDSAAMTWQVNGIASGACATLDITELVKLGTGNTTITNQAAITAASNPDPNTSNNAATVNLMVLSNPDQADLAVTNVVDNATPSVLHPFTYTITVKNTNGPKPATHVHISDPQISGVTYTSSTVTQGTFTLATGDWDIGSLTVGATETLTISAFANSNTGGQTLVNTASISADQPDPIPGNNSDSASITPVSADLGVTLLVDNSTPNVGDTVTYTITVINIGPSATTNVQVSDALPTGETYPGGAVASQGTYNGVVWLVGNLAVNGSATLHIPGTIGTGTGGGTLTNAAMISFFAVPDPNSANNTATVSILVAVPPTDTPTNTPIPTSTATPSDTATPTTTPSNTPTATPSNTPTATASYTPTPIPSATPTTIPSATPTTIPTATFTIVPSHTPTPIPSATPTLIPTATFTPTPIPSATPTHTPTYTPTP